MKSSKFAVYKIIAILLSVIASKKLIDSVKFEKKSETAECVICMSAFKSPTCCPCGHIFCWECILKCNQNICPICRKPLKLNAVFPVYNL